MKGMLCFLVIVVVCGGVGSALAQNRGTLDKIELYGTISNMGVTVRYKGDDNQNARLEVEYRPVGSSAWRKGHPLLRLKGRRFVGSLFFLQPNREYEVRLRLVDPDGSPQSRTVRARTRKNTPPPAPASGRHFYVDARRGKDSNAGTKSAPLKTIQQGVSLLQAGDTLHVMPGLYRESVTIRQKGTASAPIYVVAEGKGVILDGSDATLGASPRWSHRGNGLYSTPFAKTSLYVAADDLRLYDYGNLADLKAENGRQSGKNGILKGGFFVDRANKLLYLRLPNRSNPAQKKIHVAVRDVAFLLDGAAHIILRGFEIRYYGGKQYGSIGVDVRNSARCWIQKNKIHHINAGIRVRKTAAALENVIEENVIRDTGVWGWDWRSVKAHTPEASAISITHGRGNIVRRNRIEGQFNGIYVGSFSNSDEAIARDTDVLYNEMRQNGDDGLEPEGACINVRFVGNSMHGVHNAVSLAPIEVGPLWLLRSVIRDFKAHALKLNNGSNGWMLIYHNTALPDPQESSAQPIAPSVPFGHLIARNNIWLSKRYIIEYIKTRLSGPVDLDYDLLWTTRAASSPRYKWKNVRYKDLAAFQQGTGMEKHGVEAAPRFVNRAAGDLRPAPGSPAIDKGEALPGINDHMTKGARPDIGALEQGSAPPREPTTELAPETHPEPPPEGPPEPHQEPTGEAVSPPKERVPPTEPSPEAPRESTSPEQVAEKYPPGEKTPPAEPLPDSSPPSESLPSESLPSEPLVDSPADSGPPTEAQTERQKDSSVSPRGCGCAASSSFSPSWLLLTLFLFCCLLLPLSSRSSRTTQSNNPQANSTNHSATKKNSHKTTRAH